MEHWTLRDEVSSLLKFNKGERMTKGRHKAFLRNTSNISATGRHMINLPQDVWKEIGWDINDNLQLDIIKHGMYCSISITKEKE